MKHAHDDPKTRAVFLQEMAAVASSAVISSRIFHTDSHQRDAAMIYALAREQRDHWHWVSMMPERADKWVREFFAAMENPS